MALFTHKNERDSMTLPKGISIRPGVEADEHSTFDVLRRTMGFEMNWAYHSAIREHLRNSDQCGFWVAEETNRFGHTHLIGYARYVVRERVWSLTDFYVLPTHHRKGIGRALLARCISDGEALGAVSRTVLASQHPSADSLYIRQAGCLPRLPMLLLSGSFSALRKAPAHSPGILDTLFPRIEAPDPNRPPHTETLLAEPLIWSPEMEEAFSRLDREIIGYARPEEHRFWSRELGGIDGSSRLFRQLLPGNRPGSIVGYSYLGSCATGPSLATDPVALPAMVAHTSSLFSYFHRRQWDQGFNLPEQHLPVGGINEQMLHWLLDCGWQIVFQYLYMSSQPPGKLDRYVCHSPLYVL